MTLAEWRAGGGELAWRGHRIFTRAAGSGTAVVLVHGFPTASWDWAPIWPAIAARYRALALDMIGFGFSAKPKRFAYSVLAQADLWEAYLEREGVDQFHLVAHDYGVTVAQELLARLDGRGRGRLLSVCFLNGGLFPETHRALLAQRVLASPVGPLLARAMRFPQFAASMRRIWGTHAVATSELADMWTLVTENDGVAVVPQLLGYMAERRQLRARWVGALVEARVPVRLINGSDDPVSGAHVVARYRELVRAPDVVELAGVGHYPQVEAPDEVAAAVLDHLARR